VHISERFSIYISDFYYKDNGQVGNYQ